MKTIFENWNNFLNESGLSRVHQHIGAHDTAVITAFRNDPSSDEGCVDAVPPGEQEESPLKANKARNKNLKAVLLKMGYESHELMDLTSKTLMIWTTERRSARKVSLL